ncbi:yjl055w-like protein [Chytriomyces sp. MP71]|nr:yjl055w-like protein [Chytriomyces sp. MP71]
MPLQLKNICVFCGASPGADEAYIRDTQTLGALFAANGLGIVYGGGNLGVMGAIATSVADNGGNVLGIIPTPMVEAYGEHLKFVGETVQVPDMHSRKAMMNERSDAFVALPGGLGTFEEILEAITWSQLGIHAKPVVLLNTNGFYEPLKALIAMGVSQGFIKKENGQIAVFCDTPETVVEALVNYELPGGRAVMPWEKKLAI